MARQSQYQIPGHRRLRTLNHTIHTPEERGLKEWKAEQPQDDLTLVDELLGWLGKEIRRISTRAVHTEFQMFLKERWVNTKGDWWTT